MCEVEHGSFPPLTFSVVGDMDAVTSVFLKTLASTLVEKQAPMYAKTIRWLLCILELVTEAVYTHVCLGSMLNQEDT